jgi:hypothetical protein
MLSVTSVLFASILLLYHIIELSALFEIKMSSYLSDATQDQCSSCNVDGGGTSYCVIPYRLPHNCFAVVPVVSECCPYTTDITWELETVSKLLVGDYDQSAAWRHVIGFGMHFLASDFG